MDEPTDQQKIAGDLVRAWLDGLTDGARQTISDHDADALAGMVTAALRGDLGFLAAAPKGGE